MSDDEDNKRPKKFSTPENNSKSKSKFDEFVDDIESKIKPKSFIKNNKEEPNTNSNSNYNSNNTQLNTNDKNIGNSNNSVTLNTTSSFSYKNVSNFLSPNETIGTSKSKAINDSINKLKKLNSFNIIPKKNQKNDNSKTQNNKQSKASLKAPNNDKNKIPSTTPNRPNSARTNKNISLQSPTNIENHNHNRIRTSTPGSGLRNPKPKLNEINNPKLSSRTNKIALLTPPIINIVPQIFDDPLDNLKGQIETMLEKSNDDIGLLSNKISTIDLEMETEISKLHRSYAKNLRNLYSEKEKKLREINNKYNYELYKLSQDKNNSYDEMCKKKEHEILEIEKNFNEMKNNLKNSLQIRIELIRKNGETKRGEILNNNVIKEIRQKIFDMLNIKENEFNTSIKQDKNNQSRKARNSIIKK